MEKIGCVWINLFAFLVLVITQVSAEPAASEDALKEMIPCFAEVSEGLYRGAQPPEEAFPKLKQLGILTVVNFRHEEKWIKKEAEWVEKAGMRYISLPWTIWGELKPDVMQQFFELVKDPSARPIFFHCKRGSERTAVTAVLYRMYFEGKSEREARELEVDPYPVKMIWKPFVNKKIKEFQEVLKSGEPTKST